MGGVVRAIWRFLVSLFKPARRVRGEDKQAADDDTRAPGLREAGDDIACMDSGLLEESDARRLCIAASLNNGFCQRLASKWRYFAFGERPQPIPSHRGPVEQPQPNKTGICCSGGGIRSAAFNLGALQALQESKQRELQRAHYLAAVSGGSYICAAYSMVGKTWGAPGTERPKNNPNHPYNGYDDSNPDLFEEDEATAFARNSPEEQYLRNRSSYMAPDGAAKIYLGLRVTLGLLFNVLCVGVPIAVGAILLGLLLYGPSLEGLLPKCTDCGFHPTLVWWLVPASLAALGAFVALVRIARRPPHDRARAVAEVWSTRLLVAGGAVALVTLVLPAVVGLLDHGLEGKNAATPAGAAASVAGFAGMIAGLLAFARETVSSPAKAAKEVGAARSWLMKLSKPIRTLLINLAAWVAGPLLLFALAVLMVSVTLDNYRGHQTVLWLAAAGGALAFLLTYIAADPTSLSLHPFYKRRLCTAFALKRVSPDELGAERASAGIEQERREGVAVEREFDRLVPISKTALDKWPSLIVCAAANISDPGATPPGRSVTSFTFSAHTIGGPLVGAMKTKKYEKSLRKKRRRDLSLPAAVAMSGAAVSPSMGKESKPAFRFLLALANIRLGVWVPNPRWVARAAEDDERFMRRPRLSYLVRELLGRNRVDGKYLYVTDGGHYENLGLVELLRRGCTRVFCFDASGGDKFSALGDAVALARSELGVKIEIDPTPLSPKGEPPTARRSTTTGWIHYPDGHKGYLVYSRNVMSPGGPWDVRAHQLDDPKFPHDSTADQLYTDKKFESYRALGAEAGVRAVARMQEVSPRPEPSAERDPRDCGLPPQRVKDMLETASIQLVDLRENFAYELEHIDGAMHIESEQLGERESELAERFPVVFHCDEGLRSPAVAADYRKRNWQAFYIEGGFRRWIDDGLPVKGNGAAPASKGPKAGATPADPAA